MIRLDDVTNFITGLGTASDRSTSSRVQARPRIASPEIRAIWEQKGLGALLSILPAESMTREWSTIEGLPDGVDVKAIESQVQDLKAKRMLARLVAFGSHWPGAIMGVAVDDGMLPYMPLDRSKIKSVRGLFVLTSDEVQPVYGPGFTEPEAYMISTLAAIPVEGRLIHASRCIKYNGPIDLPEHRLVEEQYWGLPLFERVHDEARKIWSSLGYAEGVLHDLLLDVITVPGLQEAVLAGKADLVRNKVRLFTALKSAFRALIVDGGNKDKGREAETYVQKSRQVTGIPQLVEVFLPAFVAASGIPRTVLLGDSYGGLNSGGNEGEWRQWDSRVTSWQGDLITPWYTWILDLLFAAKNGPTRGEPVESYTIKHRPLRQPTTMELAEIEEKRANTARTYWEMGVLEAPEVREQYFVQGKSTISLESAEYPNLPLGIPDELE